MERSDGENESALPKKKIKIKINFFLTHFFCYFLLRTFLLRDLFKIECNEFYGVIKQATSFYP
jgi:hypothetical protein